MSENQEIKLPIKKKRWIRVVLVLLLILILLPITITLAIQVPLIQNWSKDRITKYVHNKYGAKLDINKIELNIFQHLYLNEVLMVSPDGDTIINADQLKLNVENGIFGMLSENKVIESLYLKNALIAVEKFQDGSTNFDRIFKKDNSESNLSNPGDTLLNAITQNSFIEVRHINLDNVDLVVQNHIKNSLQEFHFNTGRIDSNFIDLRNNIFHFDRANLHQPIIKITKLKESVKIIESISEVLEDDPIASDQLTEFEETYFEEKHFELICNHLKFDDARFISINLNKPKRAGSGIDYNYLDISNISIDVDTFYNYDWDYKGQLNHFSGTTSDGVRITDLYCDQITVMPDHVELASFTLQTPKSILNDTLRFYYQDYKDFDHFVDYVRMDASFRNSKVSLKDLMYFVPDLNDVQFFRDNQNEFLILSGRLSGPINRFRGRDITMFLGDKVEMKGKFSSRDLAIKDGALVNLDLKSLKTNVHTVRQIFPDIDIPENFGKLGNIKFSGKFDGYFQDFVAYGELSTDLGNSIMDMRLNSVYGKDDAEYSGTIKVIDFDFGNWLDNPDLGKATFTAEVPSGKGLTLEGLNTVVDGSIEQLEYKGYNYRNALVKGRLQKDLFDGELVIADQNIDLAFNGKVDFSDSIPHLDFYANIEKFDLEQVNLSQKDLVLSGQINLNIDDIDINNFIGEVNAEHILLENDQGDQYYIDSLLAYSYYTDDGKKLTIRSDILDLDLEGKYELTQIGKQLQYYVKNNFPSISYRLKWDTLSLANTIMDYTFNTDIHDSKKWLKLLNLPIENITNATIAGKVASENSSLQINATIPAIEYDQSVFNNLITQWNCKGPDCNIQINLDQSQLTQKSILNSIEGEVVLRGDRAEFNIRTEELFNLVNVLDVSGNVGIGKYGFSVSLDPSEIVIFNKEWSIDADNYFEFNQGSYVLNNFELKHGSERIFLDELGIQGLMLEVEDIPVALIDTMWFNEQLNFAGKLRGEATIENVNDWTTLVVNGFIDTLLVNGDNFGETYLSLGQKQKGAPLAGFLKIENDVSRLTAQGYIYPKSINDADVATVDFDLNVNNYPVKMLEYWLKDGVSNTQGEMDIDLKIDGAVTNLQMNGDARFFKGQTTINYLQTTYYFHDQVVDVSTTLLDFSKVQISDELGNRADIEGGIYHKFLADGGVDVRISAPIALLLDTDANDNNLYYGKGIGRVDATFRGPFKSVDMYINAQTAKGTELNIPISSSYVSYTGDFVTFVDFDKKANTDTEFSSIVLEGIDVKMDLSITDDAQVNIIFDERAGDIITGKGRGDLQILAARAGDLQVHGQYEIEEGGYLFTLYDIVNKPFEIKKGGTIRWSGDPYQAVIDVEADYKGLTASLQPFLIEYTETISSDTRLNTQVQLKMHLTEDLFKPNIEFDISFPNLTGELKNYADSKLNILRSDPNALNQQVFGLIVLGSFVPSNSSPLGNQFISGSSVNTLSQLFSNQLSIYITELISEAVAGNEFISGVDFDLGWNLNPELNGDAEESIISGSEVQFRLNNRLFDDRLSFNFGANIVNNSTVSNNYIAGVWGLEYYLTPDNRLKVRLYQQPEETLEGLKNKFGFGISFRKEFDSFFKKATNAAVETLQKTKAVGIR